MVNPLLGQTQPIGSVPVDTQRHNVDGGYRVDLLPGIQGGEVSLLALAIGSLLVLVLMKYAGFRAMVAVGKGS